jgi:hypothetical protein
MLVVSLPVEVCAGIIFLGDWVFFFFSFMKLRLISWNVRGLNSSQKRELVKYWLRNWKCDAVCLQETKLEKIDLQLVRSLWGNSFVDWEMLPAIGTAGGVLLL